MAATAQNLDAGRAGQARPQAAPALPPIALPTDTATISSAAQDLLAREQATSSTAT